MDDTFSLTEERLLAGDPKVDRKLQAISALLSCPTFSEAAEAVGIDRSTLARWMKQPAFDQALNHARRGVLRHTLANLQQAHISARNLYLATIRDTQAPPSARVRAAGALLKLGRESFRRSNLERRMAGVEELAHAGNIR